MSLGKRVGRLIIKVVLYSAQYGTTNTISITNYRAVGPTAEAVYDYSRRCAVDVVLLYCMRVCRDKSAAEKRRQVIQESKFLGGDMEHTHLVKGLDFALLQKVVTLRLLLGVLLILLS